MVETGFSQILEHPSIFVCLVFFLTFQIWKKKKITHESVILEFGRTLKWSISEFSQHHVRKDVDFYVA